MKNFDAYGLASTQPGDGSEVHTEQQSVPNAAEIPSDSAPKLTFKEQVVGAYSLKYSATDSLLTSHNNNRISGVAKVCIHVLTSQGFLTSLYSCSRRKPVER